MEPSGPCFNGLPFVTVPPARIVTLLRCQVTFTVARFPGMVPIDMTDYRFFLQPFTTRLSFFCLCKLTVWTEANGATGVVICKWSSEVPKETEEWWPLVSSSWTDSLGGIAGDL